MSYKPGDFYLGVIDFFGILVPGAALLYLYGERFAVLLAPCSEEQETARWVAFAVGSYVVGQFLLGMGAPLNHLLGVFRPARKDHFYQAIRHTIDLPEGVKKTRTNVFYRAYAVVRLQSPSALAEIERQMADYKLFRSLTVLFGLKLVLMPWEAANGSQWFLFGILFVIAAGRFLFLLGWTYRITFEYYALVKEAKP
jgi:hypothetical protein